MMSLLPGVELVPSELLAPVVLVDSLVAPTVLLLDPGEVLAVVELGEVLLESYGSVERLRVESVDAPAVVAVPAGLLVVSVEDGYVLVLEPTDEVESVSESVEDGLVEAVVFRLPLVVSCVVLGLVLALVLPYVESVALEAEVVPG